MKLKTLLFGKTYEFRDVKDVLQRLGCIQIGGVLWQTEDIGQAVVANPVPVSKIFVGIVVEGAPSDGAAEIGIRERIVQDPGVTEGLLQTPWLRIGGFRGEHVSRVFGYQQCFPRVRRYPLFGKHSRVVSGVGKIIEGVTIFQKAALLKRSDT